MQPNLKIFLIIICLLFDAFVYKKVITGKLQLGYSLIWFILVLILMLATIFDHLLEPLKNILGFETISNMIFLLGFFFLTLVIFSVYLKISEQNAKITKLTQEIAILKKDGQK